MTSGGRQRRDGSSKRVQLTSGDHGGPKDKKSKGQRKTSSLGSKASRAARLREVERFRGSIRAAEQRRAARQGSPAVTPPAGTEQHTPTKEHLADADTALQVYLAACIRAAHDHNWGLLRDSACQLAEAAARLGAEARSGEGIHPDDTAS
ncbi:hypothetical protein HEK616_83800 (plasmid) [Streptomyces nigrescens]|uniref:Uncharacterized protein n=1 Tax=Streptomyces nigrescens TaxID=1920 RepID=A0ABN6RE21_STRNI|nr:hypothetical protein [Streptomyces nigrescens]BDM74869.1 hypothetical protein HEK616_83560 [Streptomyces nigrescens]BDM74893.1 hypothetical protein HEK616_83800 [Streptomyces nigrescens]